MRYIHYTHTLHTHCTHTLQTSHASYRIAPHCVASHIYTHVSHIYIDSVHACTVSEGKAKGLLLPLQAPRCVKAEERAEEQLLLWPDGSTFDRIKLPSAVPKPKQGVSGQLAQSGVRRRTIFCRFTEGFKKSVCTRKGGNMMNDNRSKPMCSCRTAGLAQLIMHADVCQFVMGDLPEQRLVIGRHPTDSTDSCLNETLPACPHTNTHPHTPRGPTRTRTQAHARVHQSSFS